MIISGLQKLTLLDFPGRTACTVFTGGCNFRCPFCHNGDLVAPGEGFPAVSTEEAAAFFKKRAGLLDGVCVTGGEPLLQEGLESFLGELKGLGYQVKLDTNGAFPGRLRNLTERGLVDYVAMDLKNSPQKYGPTVGRPDLDLGPIRESVAYLLSGTVPCEFRTTVVREFHETEDFEAMGEWISGAQKYFLQVFQDSERVLRPGLHACKKEEMQAFQAVAARFVAHTEIRGL